MSRLNNVYLQREFESQNDSGDRGKVQLMLGMPEFVNTYHWQCSFQIIGIGHEKLRHAKGVDSIDALVMALRKAKVMLEFFAKQENKKITWHKSEDWGLTLKSDQM